MVQNKVTQGNKFAFTDKNIKKTKHADVGNLKNFLYFVRDEESFSDCDGRSQ